MKKVTIPMLILTITFFGGCNWFSKKKVEKKDRLAQLKSAQQEIANIDKLIEAKLEERNKNEALMKVQKIIQEKANIANTQIKGIVEKDEELKKLNDKIVANRKTLMDETVDNKNKQILQQKTMGLIAKFKSNKLYKAEIEPIEAEIKKLSEEFNKLNEGYKKEFYELSRKKQDLVTQIEILKQPIVPTEKKNIAQKANKAQFAKATMKPQAKSTKKA